MTVQLCFLDVARPALGEVLRTLAAPGGPAEPEPPPVTVVPLLLSTGYHVQSDIPAAVAPYPSVRLARHLGPHGLLADVLADRLAAATGSSRAASTVLVGAGSSRPEATAELYTAAGLLAERLRRPVSMLSMADDLPAALSELAGPVHVATYLLAEGQFVSTLRAAARAVRRHPVIVAEPLGVHPALVDLVWERYDEVRPAAR